MSITQPTTVTVSCIKITSKADVDKLLGCGLIKRGSIIVRILHKKYSRGETYTFYGYVHYSRKILVRFVGCFRDDCKQVDELLKSLSVLGVLGGDNVRY